MGKTNIIKLIGLIKELAYEQATREFSGGHWFENYVNELDALEKSILNSELNAQESDTTEAK